MKNSVNIFLLSICLLTGILRAELVRARHPDSLLCLLLDGRIYNSQGEAQSSCKVTIQRDDNYPDTFITGKGKKKFGACLRKNSSYTLTISKEGHVSKCIVVDTRLSAGNQQVYRFSFDAVLETGEPTQSAAAESTPVARIYFDPARQCFHYNRLRRAAQP